jgi:tetratricopeptide (TPR) repeat protein
LDDDAEQACADAVSADEARAELERLLADSRFKLTDRNRAFLRYIANESFAGESKGVKAYSIAIDVFGRSADFDANIDPIVRIEATRLRASLDQYYEAYGADLPIRIHLPRGHYIAEFTKSPASGEIASPARTDIAVPELAHEPPSQPERSALSSNAGKIAIGVALLTALLATANQLLMFSNTHEQLTLKPLVKLSVAARNPADQEEAERLEDDLLNSLIRFGTLRLSSVPSTDESKSRSVDAAATYPNEEGYQVSLKYGSGQDIRSVSWRIVEASTGETRASGEERVSTTTSPGAANDALLLALAQHFGAAVGELNAMELAKHQGLPKLGNSCVLEAENALSFYDRIKIDQAVECLERTLKQNPADGDAGAVLARILLFQDIFTGQQINSQRALLLADDAVAASPSSDRALIARISALYAIGRRDEAFVLGRDTIRRNPYNKELAAAVGIRMFFAGDDREGLELVRKAGMIDAIRPRSALIVLAMSAYSDGNADRAIALLQDVPVDGGVVEATRIAAFVHLDRRQDAVAAFTNALRVRSDFSGSMDALVRAPFFNPRMGSMLKADLAIARRWHSEDSIPPNPNVNSQ